MISIFCFIVVQNNVALTRLPKVAAVVSSIYRDSEVVMRMLESTIAVKDFDEIHVYGYNPMHNSARITGHPLQTTPMHLASRWLADQNDLFPKYAMAQRNLFFTKDSFRRAKWRTSLVLDAWGVLVNMLKTTDAEIIVLLENDAIVKPKQMALALMAFTNSNNDGAACYGKERTTYRGDRTVCMMFKRKGLPAVLQHVIAYHMVQPFDWILSDWSREKWTTYDAVDHGIKNGHHKSTRVE